MINLLVLVLLGYWPLEVNHGVTGTFTEFRNGHVHAGVDFSTAGQIGLPVTCFADGEIYRIKVQYRGYGNVIYVRHESKGLISVYGHLDHFMPAVEDIANRFRKARKTRYPGDIMLTHPIPVQQGQWLGDSGESGVGWPHFHFELRDAGNRPVDPGRYGFHMDHDTVAPKFHALNLYPETPFSALNGENKPASVRVKRAGPGRYTFTTVQIEGPVLLSVSVDDRDGIKGPLGLRSVRLEIDGKKLYRYDAGRFSFDNWWQSSAIYDLERTRLSPSRYAYNLNRIPGASLESQQGNGILKLEPGTHTVTIHASDFNDNQSVLNGIFQVSASRTARDPQATGGTSILINRQLVTADDLKQARPVTINGHTWQIIGYGREAGILELGNMKTIATGYAASQRLLFGRPVQPFQSPRGLRPVADTFVEIEPGTCFLRSLSLISSIPESDAKRAGWYHFDGEKKKWKYLDSSIRPDTDKTRSVEAAHFTTATFGMFLDHAEPVILDGPYRYRDRLAWKITDTGKGVDPESLFLTDPDGNRMAIDYDPDRKIAFLRMKPKPGMYRIEVSDRAGNRASARGRWSPGQ